jgi:putative tricarboxylic transport membrane protein
MASDQESKEADQDRRGVTRAADLVHGIDLIVAAILLALCAWLYYLTTQFEEVAQLFAQDVPPEFLPRLLIWTIAFLSLLVPFEHLLKPQGRAHFDKDRSKPIKPMAYATIGLLTLAVMSIEWVGTYIAIMLACLLLPVLWGERRWKILIPYALIFSTAVVLLFSKLLGVYFEPGLLGIDLR